MNITANGNSATIEWEGGLGFYQITGTFDGATVKLQYSSDGGTTYIDVGSLVSLSASGAANFSVPSGLLRINTASGGGSLDVDATILRY